MSNYQFSLFDMVSGVRVSIMHDVGANVEALEIGQLANEALGELIGSGLYAANQNDTQPAQQKQAEINGGDTQRIVGYVLGRGNDKKLKRQMPRLYLYVDYRPYSAFTVFHEKMDTLPTNILADIADFRAAFDKPNANPAMLPGALQAPAKEQAEESGIYIPCDFDVLVEPELDHNGNPKQNSGGYTLYRYTSSVGGSTPPPTVGHNGNGNGNGNGKLLPMRDATRATLHALGTLQYGDGWDNKRHELAAHFGGKRKPAVTLVSSNDLAETEAQQIIEGIEKITRGHIKRLAGEMSMSGSELMDIASEGSSTRYHSIMEVCGVPLTHMAKSIKALYDAYLEQHVTVDSSATIPF